MDRVSRTRAAVPTLDLRDSRPLKIQIADFYRQQLAAGRIARGARLPTCRDLAQRLGVSAYTIHRVFEQLAREGLVYRRRAYGTLAGAAPRSPSPSFPFRSSPRDRNGAVSLFLRPFAETELAPIQDENVEMEYLRGLAGTFQAGKVRIEIVYLDAGQPELAQVLDFTASHACKGLINMRLAPATTRQLIESRFPMVSLNQDLAADGVPSVTADSLRGYAAAWREGWALGHRRAAFLGPVGETGAERGNECAAALKLAAVPDAVRIDQLSLKSDQLKPGGYWRTLVDAFGPYAAGRWPTLLFTSNDLLATRVIGDIEEHGLRVPRDLSIIGFDDLPIARQFRPAVTTLNKPRVQMGEAAAQAMLDLFDKRRGARGGLHVLPVTYVNRKTCGAAPR